MNLNILDWDVVVFGGPSRHFDCPIPAVPVSLRHQRAPLELER